MPRIIPLVEMKKISKSFGKVKALKDIDFTVNRNEIVGLVGDNGAGKSTLIKILCGVYKPDKGEIYFEGKKVALPSPREAIRMGIEVVHQNLCLVEELNVARNIFMGREPSFFFMKLIPVLNKKKMATESEKILKDIGITISSVNEPIKNLSGGERQSVSVGRSTYFKAKLVIMDEPTAAMSVKETRNILNLAGELKEKGTSIIFISHNIHHVFSCADRIVILAHGQKIGERKKEEKGISEEEITKLIIGS